MADQNLEPKSSKVPHTKAPIPGDRQATSPAAERTERAHKHALPHPLDRRVPPSDKRDHSPNFTWADKEKSRRKNAREAEDINLSSPPSPFSSVTYSSDEDSVSSSPGRVNLPQLHNISVSPENPSDNTIHFTLDVADDIESHLEELSRLKRWGHFKEATQYFGENLEHQLDLPLVFLQYSDLLIEQGAYGERLPSGATHWWDDDQKAKCLPIGNEQHGPNLYTLHLEVLTLRAELFSQSLSGEDLDFLHTDNFWKYLDERTASRHEVRIPFDSTEVQIICNELLIRACIESKSEDAILPAVRTCCWPELYNDLLMDGRIWELSDLLRAMFRAFGIRKTFKQLFNLKRYNRSRKPQAIQCLERLLKDWALDEYDQSTELAILTILVEMMDTLDDEGQSSSMSQEDNELIFAHCIQQADQCAAEIKDQSPHLTKSRPYLRWILAKENFDRHNNSSLTYLEWWAIHIEQFPGLMHERKYLPSYIPLVTENPGWPAPDLRFPPSQNLQWALEVSKELLDYDTQARLLRELIRRERDPRPLFAELGKLQGDVQGSLVEHYESCISQYLLVTDKSSCRELLERLKSAAAKFQLAPEDDLRVATCWRGLMVQNALARIISEDAELVDRNGRLAQAIRYDLPLPHAVIARFMQSTSANRVHEARRARMMQSLTRRETAELFELRERNRDLERELGGMKLRLGLSGSEGEERPEAGEGEHRTKLPGHPSNNRPGWPDDAPRAPGPSHDHKQIPVGKPELKGGEMDEKGIAEDKSVKDATTMTKELDKTAHDTHSDGNNELEAPRKSQRYALVTEVEDEARTLAKPGQSTVKPPQSD